MNFWCRIGSVAQRSITFGEPYKGVFGYIAPGTPRAVARVGADVLVMPPGYYFGVNVHGLLFEFLGEAPRNAPWGGDEKKNNYVPSTAPELLERRTCRKCDRLAGDPSREDGSCLDYCVRHCPHQGQHGSRARDKAASS